jgi:diaminohydroxyphosphoribosylaminopyrimidine deaminase / 5-amino-6-(5-phosphoribosylamino)uracil reductase
MTTHGLRHAGAAAANPAMAVSIVAEAFRLAVEAAEAAAGATAPNPPVGCVVLDARGEVLACAAHEKAGSAHAEAAAIAACRRAGDAGRIDTLVVTLEPCNHQGRTPPCVDAILATPARTVWIGARDPNPKVAGGGAARLASHGLTVRFLDALDHPETPALARAARRLIAPFGKWSQTGRPWLALKQAIAADGGMIPPTGRKTFTSQASLVLAHRLRRRSDAIVTGSGCVLADEPAFTVRHVRDHPGKRRLLAILDRRGRTPASYVKAAEARGFDVRVRGDLQGLLAELGDAGVLEALVEAGPTLLAAFLDQDLWDERVIIRQSPGAGGPDTVDVLTRQAA